MYLFPRVVELLKEKGAEDIIVTAGGIIPQEDVAPLKAAGIKEIFGPGTSLDYIVDWTRSNLASHR
jgi:methylmalonyl-CoA mutase C-terminal domain/subunit